MSTTTPLLIIKLIFLRRDPRDLDHALHAFLNLSDAEIRRFTSSINIWGLWLEKGPSSCAPRCSTTGLKLARLLLTLFEIYKWFCLLLLSLIFV